MSTLKIAEAYEVLVLNIGGKQVIFNVNEKVKIDYMEGLFIEQEVSLPGIVITATGEQKKVLFKAVVEQPLILGEKQFVVKFKPRTRSMRKIGYRTMYTVVKILGYF